MRGVIMKRMLILQMSIFGSFENIGNNPTTVANLIPLYKNKFIPSVIQMAEIDPVNDSVKTINRLSMVSVDNKITIVFLPNRIDCNYSFKEEETNPLEIEAKLHDMCELLKSGIAYFSTIGNRIAINGRFVTDEISLSCSDYIVTRAFYEGADIDEWSTNCNTVKPLNILGAEEPTNNILNIGLGENNQGKIGLIVSFDINTIPGNSLMRFKAEALSVFLEQASLNLKSMLDGLR